MFPGLLDPKWMEDRQRSMADKSDQEEVFAPGSAIDFNLKQIAERRTDIFGVGTEETQIGKKVRNLITSLVSLLKCYNQEHIVLKDVHACCIWLSIIV